ncbi:UbiA family prenyltransferase, partial [Streptomyces sp. SID12488]
MVRLVRAPAALSVPGDVLCGAAAAGRPADARTLGTAASSVCLYWAGMALNDYVDAPLDAQERPERPIPAREIKRRTAFAAAAGLTAAGLALAAVSRGRRGLARAGALATAVWAYDLVLKDTPAGPAAMAAARGLDVL